MKGVIEIPVVYVDYREPKELVHKLEDVGLTVIVTEFPTGDIVAGEYTIERKEINDFRHSYIKPRLKEQLGRLEKIPDSILIIEGNWGTVLKRIQKSKRKNFSYPAEYQTLLKMYRRTVMETSVKVMRTKNMKETAALVYSLSLAGGDSKATLDAVRESPGRGLTNDDWQRRILEGFSKIGPKTSHKWLMKYGRLDAVLEAMLHHAGLCPEFFTGSVGKKIQEVIRHPYGKEDKKDE